MQLAIEEKNIIPQHQFGFREKHNTVEQVHRIIATVKKTFEEKKYCSALFLDVAQAFDKVWLDGLIYKIELLLPADMHKILKSFLLNRQFFLKLNNFTSRRHRINAGVPQGSVLGPTLYLIYTADLPTCSTAQTFTFADDTAILSVDKSVTEATKNLQTHLKDVEKWLEKWRIRVNTSKSTHVIFSQTKCYTKKLSQLARNASG